MPAHNYFAHAHQSCKAGLHYLPMNPNVIISLSLHQIHIQTEKDNPLSETSHHIHRAIRMKFFHAHFEQAHSYSSHPWLACN